MRKTRLRWILIGPFLWLLIASACVVVVLRPTRAPSDAEMIAHYYQHAPEFNVLIAKMQVEKELLVIYPDGKWQLKEQKLVTAADSQSCAEYANRLRQLGLGWTYTGPEPIWLSAFTSGLSVSGSRKGYLYISRPPVKLVDDTNKWDGRSDLTPSRKSGHDSGNEATLFLEDQHDE
jgi:hypothetical protein